MLSKLTQCLKGTLFRPQQLCINIIYNQLKNFGIMNRRVDF